MLRIKGLNLFESLESVRIIFDHVCLTCSVTGKVYSLISAFNCGSFNFISPIIFKRKVTLWCEQRIRFLLEIWWLMSKGPDPPSNSVTRFNQLLRELSGVDHWNFVKYTRSCPVIRLGLLAGQGPLVSFWPSGCKAARLFVPKALVWAFSAFVCLFALFLTHKMRCR